MTIVTNFCNLPSNSSLFGDGGYWALLEICFVVVDVIVDCELVVAVVAVAVVVVDDVDLNEVD